MELAGLICARTKYPLTLRRLRNTRGIQKFPDWHPGTRTANGIALCHKVQLYRYFVSQSSELCRHNTFCCFSTNVFFCCKRIFLYRLNPEIFGYPFVPIGETCMLGTTVCHIIRNVLFFNHCKSRGSLQCKIYYMSSVDISCGCLH